MYRIKWDRSKQTIPVLQAEINRLKQLLYAAADRHGYTHPLVSEISQVLDERIMDYQLLTMKKTRQQKSI